jgi:hypothetical protein
VEDELAWGPVVRLGPQRVAVEEVVPAPVLPYGTSQLVAFGKCAELEKSLLAFLGKLGGKVATDDYLPTLLLLDILILVGVEGIVVEVIVALAVASRAGDGVVLGLVRRVRHRDRCPWK